MKSSEECKPLKEKLYLLEFGNILNHDMNSYESFSCFYMDIYSPKEKKKRQREWGCCGCWEFSNIRYNELMVKLSLTEFSNPDMFEIDGPRADFRNAYNTIYNLLLKPGRITVSLEKDTDMNPNLFNPYKKDLPSSMYNSKDQTKYGNTIISLLNSISGSSIFSGLSIPTIDEKIEVPTYNYCQMFGMYRTTNLKIKKKEIRDDMKSICDPKKKLGLNKINFEPLIAIYLP